MKVLMINGSPNANGCTFTALNEIKNTLDLEGISSEIIQLGKNPIRDCVACYACREKVNDRCIFNDDIVNSIIAKANEADGFIFGSPVYYAQSNGRLSSVLNRVFFAGSSAFEYKPGAAIVSARRGGTTAAFDDINKYFTISNMPIVSSSYWNMVHGSGPDDVKKDLEGLQTMQVLAQNMAWLLKSIESAKKAGITRPAPLKNKVHTNFIR